MMTEYLIELTPCDMFFFGTENRYRLKEGSSDTPRFVADYFQRSMRFPQQTTILGALRYLVLQENGQIPITDQDKATNLIGPTGFRVNEGTVQDYGAIQSLGPVFLRKDGIYYMPAPLHLFNNDNGYKYGEPELKEGLMTNQPGQFIYFKDYDEKRGLNDVLVNIQDMTETLDYDSIFIEVEKVGIMIKQREDAYYKQFSYKFNPATDVSFVLKVTWNDDLWEPEVGKIYYVALGAEKHVFRLKFASHQNAIEPRAPEGQGSTLRTIILISDAYIEENTADFSIVKQRPFRYIESRVKAGGKYARWKKDSGKDNNGVNSSEDLELKRSDRYNLFERGSVFFFLGDEKKKDFIQKLRSREDFRQIGYNHFIES